MAGRAQARGKVTFSRRERFYCLLLSGGGLFVFVVLWVLLSVASLANLGNLVDMIDVVGRLNEGLQSFTLKQRAHEADYQKQSLLALNKVKDSIALIVVDDETLRDPRFNEWPIPRSRYAEVIAKMEKAGARAIGIDVLFLEAQKAYPKADEALRDALKRSQKAVLVDTVIRNGSGALVYQEPLPLLTQGWSDREKLEKLGVTYEGDESVKSVPLTVALDEGRRFSFDTLLAAHALGAGIDRIVDHSERGFVQIGDRSVPLMSGALTINYFWLGTATQSDVKYDTHGGATAESLSVNYYPMSALYDMSDADLGYYFKDRTVLLGVTAQAGHDLKITPVGKMAGIEVHANALLTILSEGYVYVLGIYAEAGVALVLCLLIGAALPRLDARIGALTLFALEAGLLWVSYALLLRRNIWFAPALPMLSAALAFVLVTLYLVRAERRAKMLMKSLFEKATPVREEDVIEFLLSGKTDADQFEPELEVRERTVVFSDIRDYTVMSESMNADRVMNTLNVYYSEMQTVVNECGGKIWEYIGDAQMVVFGEKTNGRYPPECQVLPEFANMNPSDQAVHASIRMVEKLEQLNARARETGLPVLDIGIGINSGPISLGTIKNKGKLVFAAIGDAVNVAARMQAMSKEMSCRILLTDTTYNQLEDVYLSDRIDNIKVKGKAEPMTVHRIFAGQQARERETRGERS